MNITVSPKFKSRALRAIFSIFIFFLLYVILTLTAIGLTALCVIVGVKLIIFKPMFVTIGIGAAMASIGFFILIFLFKFVFKKQEIDRSHLVEIFESDEPRLFKFIRDIVSEVDTEFPKKIYLSTDVNACVFYDSTFWSMIFPVKKNLQIGLGLVNSITQQELKAILAHEFGHFSQRSMRVGSYVNNVNMVIFNMLFDNEDFENMIQRWANVLGNFSVVLILAVKIIHGIKWLLSKIYVYVNTSYMALSREMEFHADEIAANVAGSQPLIESLLRMNLADYSLNAVLGHYEQKTNNKIKSKNIYAEQKFVMNFLASENNLPVKNNLPLITLSELNKQSNSKLNIEDQWASHPSTEERIVALEKLGIQKSPYEDNFANQLFTKGTQTEEQITEKLFLKIAYDDVPTDFDTEAFKSEFIDMHLKNSFPKYYNGYYNNKNPIIFDIDSVLNNKNIVPHQSLFTNENVGLINTYNSLENDKLLLQNIEHGQREIKTFDYDGQKYKATDATKLIAIIDEKINQKLDEISNVDANIFKYFYELANKRGCGQQYKEAYLAFISKLPAHQRREELYNSLLVSTQFLNIVTPYEEIRENFVSIAEIEIEIKKDIAKLLEKEELKSEITLAVLENLNKYLSKDLLYYSQNAFDEDNLQILFAAMSNYQLLISKDQFLDKNNFLTYQMMLASNQ